MEIVMMVLVLTLIVTSALKTNICNWTKRRIIFQMGQMLFKAPSTTRFTLIKVTSLK